MNDTTVIVTGAAGFIGSAVVRELRRRWSDLRIVSFDALTYAGNRANLADLDADPAHVFVRADITDREAVTDHGDSVVCVGARYCNAGSGRNPGALEVAQVSRCQTNQQPRTGYSCTLELDRVAR